MDEHTLRALGILRRIERGRLRKELPLASDLAPRIHLRRALYLALFCHDIAKGRPGDHSALGADIARKLAARFHLTHEESETAAWLVEHHLVFSDTAFRRDLSDPKTIADFAEKVRTVERLRLLLVLTAADIRAVGPGVWNAWKATLLRELYSKAESWLRTGSAEAHIAQARQHLRQSLRALLPVAARAEVDAYLEDAGAALLAACDAAAHARLIENIRSIRAGEALTVDASHSPKRGVSEIRICTRDRPGLFARLTGALLLSGASIAGAQIFTLKDGVAMDIFHVQSAEAGEFESPEKLKRLKARITRSLKDDAWLDGQIEALKSPYPSSRDALSVHPQVFTDTNASGLHTLIEISARDRPGLLYRIARTLASLKIVIYSAHVTTYGEQAADTFYVKDAFGHKIDHAQRLAQIREALLKALEE